MAILCQACHLPPSGNWIWMEKITSPLFQNFWLLQRNDNCTWTVKVCWTHSQGTDGLNCIQTTELMAAEKNGEKSMSSLFLSELQMHSCSTMLWLHWTPCSWVTGHVHPHSHWDFPAQEQRMGAKEPGEIAHLRINTVCSWLASCMDKQQDSVTYTVLAQFSCTSVYALSQAD